MFRHALRLGLAGWSGGHGRQPDEWIIADRSDAFQGQVAGTLDGPLVVLLEQDGADQADDGGLVGEDADDVGAPLDLADRPLQRVGGVQLGAVLAGKLMSARTSVSASSISAASLGTFGRSWSATRRHCCLAAAASSWAKAVAMKAETTRRPCRPAWAVALRMKCTRQRCQVVPSTLGSSPRAGFSSPPP